MTEPQIDGVIRVRNTKSDTARESSNVVTLSLFPDLTMDSKTDPRTFMKIIKQDSTSLYYKGFLEIY